ncbi:NADH-quinone oxidoreductase subunit J [Halostagnicola bangensis]
MMEAIAFYLFAIITLSSALGVVLFKDPWHSALMLGISLLSIAVYYVMLAAEFMAMMQILVYIGGVLILITFAVMLTQRDTDEIDEQEVTQS